MGDANAPKAISNLYQTAFSGAELMKFGRMKNVSASQTPPKSIMCAGNVHKIQMRLLMVPNVSVWRIICGILS